MKAVILAGGKGTRLASLAKHVPKPLLLVGEKPVLEHQIMLLKSYDVQEIWILVGHLGQRIKEYFKDGKQWSIKIRYVQEKEPRGTAGALKALEHIIQDDFLVLSGDVMLDFDIQRFITWHRSRQKSIASLVVHPSDHMLDSDLVDVDHAGKVTSLFLRPHQPGMAFRNLSIASAYIFSPDIFQYIPHGKKSDFEKDILPTLFTSGEMIFAYRTPEYIKDMGTPERLVRVRNDYASGRIKKLNLRNKRKAVFLDRDGVLNEEVDQLSRREDFRLFTWTAEAIKRINNADYLAIVVTNQPMVAKGFLSETELGEIHKQLETELASHGAKLDAIYYCPHHPEKGFAGEIPELKITCDCRKPNSGLIKRAVDDFNVDVQNSLLIGDSSVDAKTAERAHLPFVGVKTGYGCTDNTYTISHPFPIYNNLLEAVEDQLPLP